MNNNDSKTKLNTKGGDNMEWTDVTRAYYKRQKGKKAIHLKSRYEEIYISKPTDIDWQDHMYYPNELVANILGKSKETARYYKGDKGTSIYFATKDKAYRVFIGEYDIYISTKDKSTKAETECRQLSLFDGEL